MKSTTPPTPASRSPSRPEQSRCTGQHCKGDEHGSRRTQQMANDCNLGVASSSWTCLFICGNHQTYGNRTHDRVLCGYWVGTVVSLPDRCSRYCGSSPAFCTEMDSLCSNNARLLRGNGNLDLPHRLPGDPTWGSGSSEMVVVPLVLTLLAILLAWLIRPHRGSGGSLP